MPLLSGVKPEPGDKITEMKYQGKTIKCGSGIAMQDSLGVKAARKSGWISSFKMLDESIGKNGDYYWDIKSGEGLEPIFSRFSNALLRLQKDRKTNLKVTMDATARADIINNIFTKLLDGTTINQEHLNQTGYLVLRAQKEVPSTTSTQVTQVMKEFVKMGSMPPVIITPAAMEKMYRTIDLLELEERNIDTVVIMEPNIDQGQRHSTATTSMLDSTIAFIEEDISEIMFNQDTITDDLTSYAERSLLNLTQDGEMSRIVDDLNCTTSKQRELVMHVNNQKLEMQCFKMDVTEQLQQQVEEMDSLKQTVSDSSQQLNMKNEEIDQLKKENSDIKQEYELEVTKLEQELNIVENKQMDERRKGPQVPVQELDAMSDQLETRDAEIDCLKMKDTKLRKKHKTLEKDFQARYNTKTEELELQLKSKQKLEDKIHKMEVQLTQMAKKVDELKAENTTLNSTNTKLTEKMKNINSKMWRLSAQSNAAEETKSSMENIPTFKTIKRQDAIETKPSLDNISTFKTIRRQDAIDQQHTFIPSQMQSENTTLPTPNRSILSNTDVSNLLNTFQEDVRMESVVATMTTKEATGLIPRWNGDDSIVTYTKKISNCWEICKAESFDEGKVCKLLRLQLNINAAEVFDNLPDEEQKVVATVIQKLKEVLDKQKMTYLQELSQVQKSPTESHATFSLKIRRLYKSGTGSTSISNGEKQMMVQSFLAGLPRNESSALRMVASEAELKDIDLLAKRAARSTIQSNDVTVNAVDEQPKQYKKIPYRNNFSKKRFTGKCFYCNILGHSYRECYKRSKDDPEWQPKYNKTS